jgi:hypothetical protein
VHGIVHTLGISLKHVENQSASTSEMLLHAAEAIHLLFHFQQVLERPERNNDQPEFFAKIEMHHIALDEMDALARFHDHRRALFHRAFQHALGEVESRHALPRFGQRHSDAPSAASQFEDGVAVFPRRVAIKRHVLGPAPDQWRFIVIFRDERIVQRRRRTLFVCRKFMCSQSHPLRRSSGGMKQWTERIRKVKK